MPVGTEFDGAGKSRDLDDRALDALAGGVVDRVALAPHVGDVALFEIRDAPRDAKERGGIGGEEVVAVAQAHHQRTSLPRTHDTSGLARRDHRDRVRALEFGDGELDRAQQVAVGGAVPVRVHEVRDRLAVGLRVEHVTLLAQPVAQRFEVLDDAVVDDGHFAARRVRMRIHRRRCTVRGPARVRDAGGAGQVARGRLRVEVGDARRRHEAFERAVLRAVEDREARRVVPAVFEPADAFDQDGNDVAAPRRANDAAHGTVTPSGRRPAASWAAASLRW